MIYLRSAAFFLVYYLSTIPFLPIALVANFFEAKKRSHIISYWARFLLWWLKVTCNLKLEVSGLDNVPKGNCIYASNHQSEWEAIYMQTFLPPIAWVLKRELLMIPVFGWGLWITRPIAIDRSKNLNALEQVTRQGLDKIAEGRSVLIFPEGSRMPVDKPGKYKKGAARLARQADVPIVPIYHDAGKYWPKSSFLKYPGTVKCKIGKPISLADKTDVEVMQEVKDWIVAQTD
jgi:1-acyl-sn-glycerol-3-phosphate acyltransferase